MSFKVVPAVLTLTCIALASTGSAAMKPGMAKMASSGHALQRYFIHDEEPMNFFEAWHKCRSHGHRLATVNSAKDDLKLMMALDEHDGNQAGPWWIAGTDLGKTGSFVWITTNRRVVFKKFAPEEPNNQDGKEHCLEVAAEAKWNDVDCDKKNLYICELDT